MTTHPKQHPPAPTNRMPSRHSTTAHTERHLPARSGMLVGRLSTTG
jgi:hypothetical protein